MCDAGGMSTEDSGPGDADREEMKRKFREALDRKKGKGVAASGETTTHGKVDHAQGSQAHSKMFRRKAGG